MKKNMVLFMTALSTFSLMAFGYMNWNDSSTHHASTIKCQLAHSEEQINIDMDEKVYSDFFYRIGPRFTGMKKTEIDQATSFNDFLSEERKSRVVSYQSVSVVVIIDDKHSDIIETGNSDILTTAQLNILQSSDYSTNLKLMANLIQKNEVTGNLEHTYSTPHITVVPEKQAVYRPGNEIFLEYIRANNKENIANLDESKLQPAKLTFTVQANGTLSNINLDRTSGYTAIDKTMIALLNSTSGQWEPAENVNGEKMEQELVISFGMVGC